MRLSRGAGLVGALMAACFAAGQVIEFESGGLKYQTLTRDGVTIMFAHLPSRVQRYAIIQVAVSNGSSAPCTLRPEDFWVEYPGGQVRAVPAAQVINQLAHRATSADVIKLVTTYELGLYGIQRTRSTNGYEQRRQSALAFGSAKGLKAAAAASAIAFVETTLQPGQSTDGAVFYPIWNATAPAGQSIVKVLAADREFEFAPSIPNWMQP